MQNVNLRSHLFLHGIVFIWGFTAVLGALISIEAIPLVWYRMVIASLLIFAFIRWKKISLKADKKTIFVLLISGVLIALHWLSFFGAIKMANVSITLAMLSTGAFFTSILEPIFYKRKFIWYEVVLGLIVIAGLYIIFRVEMRYLGGMLLALFSALLASVFSLINGKYVQRHNPYLISFYEFIAGATMITLFLAFTGKFNTQFFDLSQTDWIYILILSSVCTAFAFIAGVAIMKHLTPYTVMLTTNLEPVYGIILAFLILGDTERMDSGFYIGALVILLTVILNGILKNRRRLRQKKR